MAAIFRHVEAPAPRYMMRLRLIEALLERLDEPLTAFAEIGPGRGDVSAWLKDRFPTAGGRLFEYSPAGHAHLRERFLAHPGIEVRAEDFTALEHPADLDLVIACEVLEHIPDDESALEVVRTMLRPGGRFLASVPAYMRRWQQVDRWAGHVRRYERDELRGKLAHAGFEIEAFWMYGFPVTELLYPVRQLYYRAQRAGGDRSREDATRRSGIERPLAARLSPRLVALALAPFFPLQWLVRNGRLGDGFLVLARRRD